VSGEEAYLLGELREVKMLLRVVVFQFQEMFWGLLDLFFTK